MPSAFLDRAAPPKESDLLRTLGRTAPLWNRLHSELGTRFAPLTSKWSFSGGSHGWLLRLMQRRQTLLYLVPGRDSFVASFALDESTCRAVRSSRLPDTVKEAVESAPRFAEGRGVRLDVRSPAHIDWVLQLVALEQAD